MANAGLKLLDLDVFKAIRETIDWLVEKYKGITDAQSKNQLNKVANQISLLIAKKTAYLSVLKKSLSSKEEYIDTNDIREALQTAEADTQVLNTLIKGLNAKEVTFSLKHSLEKFASLKQEKVSELKKMITGDKIGNEDQEKVIQELEAFEQRWVELGNKIDLLFKET